MLNWTPRERPYIEYSMGFNLLVTGSPFSTLACHQALRFAVAAQKANKQIEQVFFYQDAVLIGHAHIQIPANEPNIQAEWLNWSKESGITLHLCIAACLRRGIMNTEEAIRHQKQSQENANKDMTAARTLKNGFAMSGLGQFTAACINSDATLTFGA